MVPIKNTNFILVLVATAAYGVVGAEAEAEVPIMCAVVVGAEAVDQLL